MSVNNGFFLFRALLKISEQESNSVTLQYLKKFADAELLTH
jgi:hypothetical protein